MMPIIYAIDNVLSLRALTGLFQPANANCADGVAACTEDPSFNGWSIGGGYVFGGNRNYKIGKFKRVTVDNPVTEGGWGALSVNARFDRLDLTDEGIDGGDLNTFAAGVSWWLHKQARIQFNYYNADATLSGVNVGPSLGIGDVFEPIDGVGVARAFDDDTVDGFIARLQFDF